METKKTRTPHKILDNMVKKLTGKRIFVVVQQSKTIPNHKGTPVAGFTTEGLANFVQGELNKAAQDKCVFSVDEIKIYENINNHLLGILKAHKIF